MAQVLLCAVIEDNRRVLFLEKQLPDGKTRYCLPHVITDERENPLIKLKEIVLQQTGIDANVGGVVINARHNAGSRKRRQWIGVLAFSATAKNYSTKAPCRWMRLDEAKKQPLTRECEWLKTTK